MQTQNNSETITVASQEINFDEHEKQEISDSIERKQKLIWFGEPKAPIRKRIYQFIATLFVVIIRNFTSKLSWQLGLVLYLLITVPIGTFFSIKFIINLFLK